MNLSLSSRIAESFLSKKAASMQLEQLADMAIAAGYDSLCMRASQVGVHSTPDQITRAAQLLQTRDLGVSMISGDFDVVYNNDRGPNSLRDIRPYLDLAEQLGASLLRVCIKSEEDITQAQQAADQAAARGLRLAHQCHVQSRFETVDEIVATLQQVDRPNFGLIFEAANLEECRQDYGPNTIRQLAPWIFNVYLQNQKIHRGGSVTIDTWSHGPISFDVIPIPEAGGIDFDRVFQGLHEIGYDGPVTAHQSAPEDGKTTPLTAAKDTAEFLRKGLSIHSIR